MDRRRFSLEECIEYIVQLRMTREPEFMLKMFNVYVRSRIEYSSLVWNPCKKEDIVKLERIKMKFTSKIGLEKLKV